MPQKESYTDREKSLLPNLISLEFATMGKKRIEDFVNMQTELFENLQEANRHWLERVQSEATLASEFATKLTATRSISDAMTTWLRPLENPGSCWGARSKEVAGSMSARCPGRTSSSD